MKRFSIHRCCDGSIYISFRRNFSWLLQFDVCCDLNSTLIYYAMRGLLVFCARKLINWWFSCCFCKKCILFNYISLNTTKGTFFVFEILLWYSEIFVFEIPFMLSIVHWPLVSDQYRTIWLFSVKSNLFCMLFDSRQCVLSQFTSIIIVSFVSIALFGMKGPHLLYIFGEQTNINLLNLTNRINQIY